jgi:hypothetical protein
MIAGGNKNEKQMDNGILWNEVRLDTSLLLKSGSAYPNSIWRPFVYEGKLYGYYDMSWEKPGDAPGEPTLLSFDLATGSCKTFEVPGTLDICEYKPGYVLLLQDSGASSLVFREMSLSTGEIGDIPVEIPVQIDRAIFDDSWTIHCTLGGLAYNPVIDQIAFAFKEQVWSSSAGTPFAPSANLPQNSLIRIRKHGSCLMEGMRFKAQESMC